LLDKHLKKLKHDLIDFPDKFKHLFQNKFEPTAWDMKVSMEQAFILLEHGMDP